MGCRLMKLSRPCLRLQRKMIGVHGYEILPPLSTLLQYYCRDKFNGVHVDDFLSTPHAVRVEVNGGHVDDFISPPSSVRVILIIIIIVLNGTKKEKGFLPHTGTRNVSNDLRPQGEFPPTLTIKNSVQSLIYWSPSRSPCFPAPTAATGRPQECLMHCLLLLLRTVAAVLFCCCSSRSCGHGVGQPAVCFFAQPRGCVSCVCLFF